MANHEKLIPAEIAVIVVVPGLALLPPTPSAVDEVTEVEQGYTDSLPH